MDGTWSGSCPMGGFGISSGEPSGSTTRQVVRIWGNGITASVYFLQFFAQ
jgi:hypothetical protein